MSQIRGEIRTFNKYEPADYTAGEVRTVIGVEIGEMLLGLCLVRITEVFNGSGTAAKIEVGDADDDNGLLEDGQCDEETAGLYRGGGAYYATRPKLYTSADTIDITFTANTSGSRTTGILDLMVEVHHVSPY